MTKIDDLCEDELIIIFKYLTNLDLINLKRTNRFFYILLKNKNFKPKGFELNFCYKQKWSNFIYDDKPYFYYRNILFDIKNKINYTFHDPSTITCLKLYKNEFYVTKFNNEICVLKYSKDKQNLKILRHIIDNDVNNIVNFQIANDKIYFCGKFDTIICYDCQGNFIKRIKTKFCSSKVLINYAGTIIMTTFDRQSAVSFYNENDEKELTNYSFKRFGKITHTTNSGNYFYLALSCGNVNVFFNQKLIYFIKFGFNIDKLLAYDNTFYVINEKNKIKFCSNKKVINTIDYSKFSFIINYALDEKGNLCFVYKNLNF